MRAPPPVAGGIAALAVVGVCVISSLRSDAVTPPRQQETMYGPEEWQSVTMTRFARAGAVGPRYVGVATAGGLLFYDRTHEQWELPLTRADGLPDTDIRGVGIAGSGAFYVETSQGSGVVEPSVGRFRTDPFASPRPERPVEMPANLFASPGFQYLGASGGIVGPAAITAEITDAVPDEGSGLWIATWGLGTGRAELRSRSLEMLPHGLWTPEVRAAAVRPGALAAGGTGQQYDSGGITRWDRERGTWTWDLAAQEPGLLGDRVWALAWQGRTLWVGLDGGVARRTAGGRWKTWTTAQGLPDDRVTALAAEETAAWVGTMRGAATVSGDSLSRLPLPRSDSVRGVAAGAGGTWFATGRGAYVWREGGTGGSLARLEHPRGALDGGADAVTTWQEEVWWAGPMGVLRYDASAGGWLEVPARPPFRAGEVMDIAADEENVWIAAVDGLHRLIRSTGQWFRYDEGDGLLDRRVLCVVLYEDEVWLGTPAGLTRFDTRLRRNSR
ncbi:MAG: hypothetical protein R6W82_11485 [bacterium]